MSESRQYCTFFLNEHWYGFPVEQVQEVIQEHEITPVPLAPSAVRGLINLRGQILTVVDLRRRLQLPDRDPQQRQVNMIVQAGEEVISFLVDCLEDVRYVEAAQFELPPDTLDSNARELILGSYKLDQGLLLALDVEKAADIRESVVGE